MYRIAICDDEPIFVNHLRKMTEKILLELGVDYEITACTESVRLLDELKKEPHSYHLLMLDILLGRQNGVELAQYLRKEGNDISILFISSSRDFALEGYSVYPVHYLLKPVRRQQLFEVIQKELREKFLIHHITIHEKGGDRVVELNGIIYIEVLNRKIFVHTEDRDYETAGVLKEFLRTIPAELFVQCHKSFVVNMSKISKVSRTKILLNNGIEVPVGRAYYQDAISKFISYID